MRKSGLIYPLLLLVCWTGLLIAGNYAILNTTVRQCIAAGYSVAQGKIVSSKVGQGPMSRRGIEIEYNYTVKGVNYTGHRFRYDDRNEALKWSAMVEQYPRWAARKVYYNPRHPADSLLSPGMDGCDLLILLFALPLDVVTFVLWDMLLGRWREIRPMAAPAGGVRILKQARETRVSLEETPALKAGFYGAAVAAFVLSFPVVLLTGFDPPMRLMKEIWGISLLAGLGALAWSLIRNRSGVYDLRLDQSSQTVILPQTAGRKEPLAISQLAIAGVSIQRRSSASPSGTHFSYLPALAVGAGPMPLVTWGWSEQKARAFTQWLSQELGVEFKGIEEEKA